MLFKSENKCWQLCILFLTMHDARRLSTIRYERPLCHSIKGLGLLASLLLASADSAQVDILLLNFPVVSRVCSGSRTFSLEEKEVKAGIVVESFLLFDYYSIVQVTVLSVPPNTPHMCVPSGSWLFLVP